MVNFIWYLLYKTGELLAFILPSFLAYWVVERISELYFFFPLGKWRRYREAVLSNLSLFVKKEDIRKIALSLYRNYGRYLREFLWLSHLKEKDFFRQVTPVGLENFQRALKEGKGVILLSCHFGNWEWGGISAALCGYPVNFLVREHPNPFTSFLFQRLREKKKIKVIPLRRLREVVQALLRNEIVAILGDEETEKGVEVSFFGKKICLSQGPFRIARTTGASLVPAFIVRGKDKKQKGIVEPPFKVEKTPFPERDLQRAAQNFVKIWEDYLKWYPDHWLLLQQKEVR